MGKAVVPAELADVFDRTRKEAVAIMLERRAKIKDGIGERPYKGEPVNDNEALVKFGDIANDPVEWALIIEKVGKRSDDGTVRMPKKLMAQVRKYNALLNEGVFNGG
jgi:hypothetical protein